MRTLDEPPSLDLIVETFDDNIIKIILQNYYSLMSIMMTSEITKTVIEEAEEKHFNGSS